MMPFLAIASPLSRPLPRAARSAPRRAVQLLLLACLVPAFPLACRAGAPTPEPRYLIFWRSPQQAADLLKRVGTRGSGSRILGFGLPISTFEQEPQVAGMVEQCFSTASRLNIAVMFCFDFHTAWQNRPDLWNWFDPGKPGYNPANRRNVEWFGWDGPPARTRYLNWGVPERIAPTMCYTSARMREEWRRLVRRVIVPPLKAGLARLRSQGKERLFAGVLVGSEPTFDDYRQTDPVTARMITDDGGVRGRTGYRSLMDRGYSRSKPPARMEQALGDVIQETVAFWCRQLVEAGLPAAKLYPHVTAPAPAQMTGAPISAAFNRWSRPGWTTYPNGVLEAGFAPLYTELRKHRSGPWAGVEANAGFPGAFVGWETYLGWHFNHGAVVMAINTGASGTELPDRLEKSAYGPEALAAYRRFLGGQPLRERPVKVEHPEVRIKRKVEVIQAEFRRWQAAGSDPSPIAMRLEQQMPVLSQAGKIAEIDALLDAALKELKAGPGR